MDPIRFARGIKALRQRRGWRQDDLASAARVSRSVVARVEQGRGDRIAVHRLDRIAAAVGARVIVRLDWAAEQLDRLIDRRHAGLSELVVRLLSAWGWVCATEVTFSTFGERGSIDILAYHPATGTLLVIEIKSALPELGNTLIALDRKARLAAEIAAERGWQARSVARLLVIEDGRSTRRRVADHRAVLGAALPVRGWDVRRWLADPKAQRGWAGLWLLALDLDAAGKPKQRVRRAAAKRDQPTQLPAAGHEEAGRRSRPT